MKKRYISPVATFEWIEEELLISPSHTTTTNFAQDPSLTNDDQVVIYDDDPVDPGNPGGDDWE